MIAYILFPIVVLLIIIVIVFAANGKNPTLRLDLPASGAKGTTLARIVTGLIGLLLLAGGVVLFNVGAGSKPALNKVAGTLVFIIGIVLVVYLFSRNSSQKP